MIAFKRFALIIEKALKTRANTSEKVVTYGDNNLYPQEIFEMIYSSKTASAAVEKMTENIVCEGFKDKLFGAIKNEHGYTMDDVLDFTASDVCRLKAFAWIIQYSADGSRMIYNVPIEYVRAQLNDNYLKDPRVKNWVVFNNWERETIKSTNLFENQQIFPTYDPANFAAECEEYGGIENHPGQLLYVNLSTTKPYSLSPFHAVQSEMRSEANNSTYVEKTLTRGFHMCKIVSHGDFDTEAEQDAFRSAIGDMMGTNGLGSILTVRDTNITTDKPFIKVDDVGTPIESDLYKAYSEPLKKDIAIAAYNIPIPLIDSSLVNFSNSSGEVVREMRRVYRKSLQKVRNRISREFAEVFGRSVEQCEILNELSESNQVNALSDGVPN